MSIEEIRELAKMLKSLKVDVLPDVDRGVIEVFIKDPRTGDMVMDSFKSLVTEEGAKKRVGKLKEELARRGKKTLTRRKYY